MVKLFYLLVYKENYKWFALKVLYPNRNSTRNKVYQKQHTIKHINKHFFVAIMDFVRLVSEIIFDRDRCDILPYFSHALFSGAQGRVQ